MKNMIQIFENAEFGTIRTIEEHGKVLFCGNDVAAALGYHNPRKALADHCRCVTKRYATIQNGQKADGTPTFRAMAINFVTESDIYRLAAQSELPEAEQFEAWIFDEVLPTIRRTGMYATDRLLDEPELVWEALEILQKERQKRLAVEQELSDNLPKIQYADAVCASRSCILVGDMAKILKQNGIDIGQNRLFEYMRQNGYLMREGSRRNMPTQRAMDMGLFEVNQTAIISPRGVRLSRTPKITGKGQLYFLEHFQKLIS